jgi:hypothetical protein
MPTYYQNNQVNDTISNIANRLIYEIYPETIVNVFIFFENPLQIFSQESIQEKINYCEKLKERIYTLLRTDEKKASEDWSVK